MPLDIKTHLAQVAASQTPLWVDGWQYGQQLLNKGGAAPWADVGAFVSFYSKLQGLVQSDVLVVEVGEFYQNWLLDNPALLAAMGEKRRLGYAMRTLLADQGARNQLHEIVKAVCDTNAGTPVLLAMPSPKRWIGEAHCKARALDTVEVSWDDAESAAMYVADFVRSFADCDLSGVLLRDTVGGGPADSSDVARYQPVINVAQHYHWQVSLDGCADGFVAGADSGVALCLGAPGDNKQVAKLSAVDWEKAGSQSLAQDQSWYVEVPPDAVPEQVLEVLAKLREKSQGS
jgi:hypothetical protein